METNKTNDVAKIKQDIVEYYSQESLKLAARKKLSANNEFLKIEKLVCKELELICFKIIVKINLCQKNDDLEILSKFYEEKDKKLTYLILECKDKFNTQAEFYRQCQRLINRIRLINY